MEQIRSSRSILLVSCYELGHQPAGVAMPAGLLRRAGFRSEAMDVSIEGFDPEKVKRARFVGISVPMHTALRLGVQVAKETRKLNPKCHISFYGLYAALNADYLLDNVADSVIGGEFEEALVKVVQAVDRGAPVDIPEVSTRSHASMPVLARLDFTTPDRSRLVGLNRYARLEYNGGQRIVGYVETSRGCLHHCTHCPIPSVYNGRFFIVPEDIVLQDIRGLVASGAQHITFGDPDFLNGPGHSLRIIRKMHAEFPDLTFDFTAKVEHLLKHRELIPEFAQSGCIFIVSAVESLSNTVLEKLKKDHTREDIVEALRILQAAGIAMRPTFLPFAPWATIDDYIDILEFIDAQGLIDHVDPVQYSIRLLVPPGSILLSEPDNQWVGPLIQESFSYEWVHPDPRLDKLQRLVSAVVEEAAGRNEDAQETFHDILELAYATRGDESPARLPMQIDPSRIRPPRLTEAWFCCAEPTRDQFDLEKRSGL